MPADTRSAITRSGDMAHHVPRQTKRFKSMRQRLDREWRRRVREGQSELHQVRVNEQKTEEISDARCSDLALERRTISGRRTHHARRHLLVPSGTIRMASRRNRLLPGDNGSNDYTSKRAE